MSPRWLPTLILTLISLLWLGGAVPSATAQDGDGGVVRFATLPKPGPGFPEGIAADGAAKGLLFPASLVFSRGAIYVTNLALPLTEAQGDEPEEDVTTYTVARIPID